MYTKYLTDRGQRLAFIETHKAMEHKKESESELQRTQKLLDSSEWYFFRVIPMKRTQGRCRWRENIKTCERIIFNVSVNE